MTGPHGPAGSGRQRPVQSSFVLSMVGAAARGAGLVALAVGIGVVLLWIGDDDGARLASSERPEASTTTSSPRKAASTTSTSSTTSTTMTTAPAMQPADVMVLVLNGTEQPNQARPLSARLADAGYRTLKPDDAPRRTDSVVLCRASAQPAALALLAATGLEATIGDLDTSSDLPGASEADCVVVIGAP